jgi:shikimate kinase
VVDRLILVGMMGAGKTTVGQMLAERLGWEYLDSDAQVVADTGRTVPELFAEEGEALGGTEPVVVAAAGGVVLSASNRDLLMRSGVVVWLRAAPEVLARRVGTGAGRPLLDDDPAGTLTALYEVRRPLYESVAAVTVDVDGLTPDQLVDRVLSEGALADRGIGRGVGSGSEG